MVCEALCAPFEALGRYAAPYTAARKRAASSERPAEVHGVPVETAERADCRDLEDGRSNEVIWAPEEWCLNYPRLGPAAALAPVAMTGSLVGTVRDPDGLVTQVCLLVRDPTEAVVRECYLALSRAVSGGVRFEVRGLPADTYTLEVRAPGFCREVRCGVRVEATCVTNVGIVRLMRPSAPRSHAPLRHERTRPTFLHLPSRRAGLRPSGTGLLKHSQPSCP